MVGLRSMAAWWAALLAAMILAAPAHAQPQPDFNQAIETVDGRRVALVIGNGRYNDASWQTLPNAINDAEHIRNVLSDPERGSARFEVDLVTDGTKAETEAALRAFSAKARDAAVAVIYYAGHGFQVNGESYLVPKDAPKTYDEGTAGLNFIAMSNVTASARASGVNIMFLDACRTDAPLEKPHDPTRGLERASQFGAIDAPEMVIFYATSLGDPAYDAAPKGSKLSPFATAVGAGMQATGQDLPMIIGKVGQYVRQVTKPLGQTQTPISNATWAVRFYFVPPIAAEELQQAAAEARPRVKVARKLAIPDRILGTQDGPTIISLLLESHAPADILALAQEGDPLAQYAIGTMYSMGAGIARDDAAALKWLELSAESGAPIGQAALAYVLLNRANPDLKRAESLLRSASASGMSKAKSLLAGNLLSGRFGAPARAEAMALWRAAAAEGHAYAAYALVLQDERTSGIATLTKLAADGNTEADAFLCELLPGADGAPHCLTAAKTGHATARALTAIRYRDGVGVEKSKERAKYWAGLAAGMPGISPGISKQIEPLLH